MRSIKVVGYDMDYTLVHYRVEDWERRAYEYLQSRLASKGWPVADLSFDPELVVRGLIIDTEHGNLLKANRFGYVKAAYHGTRRMDFGELRETYMSTVVDLSSPRFRFLNTLFALSEGCMYAQLVDRLDAGEIDDEAIGYHDLYERVRAHIDATHMEGELKGEIVAAPEKFVELDEEMVWALLDQHHAGKKLVLITNSEWPYTLAMMSYVFDRFLPGDMTWRDLFDLTMVQARKPSFFEQRAPLLRVIDDEGRLEPHIGPLEPHGCYFGGHATLVEQHFGVTGDEVLFFGDHMYGDVHVSKRQLKWRTALVLRELEAELVAVEETRRDQSELASLMRDKEQLEFQHYQLRLAMQRAKRGYGPRSGIDQETMARRLGELRDQLVVLDQRIAPIAKQLGAVPNERWGLLMRAGNDKSQLARKIERYADIYTSRVSNLLFATPFVYLRSPRGSLPHDPAPARALL